MGRGRLGPQGLHPLDARGRALLPPPPSTRRHPPHGSPPFFPESPEFERIDGCETRENLRFLGISTLIGPLRAGRNLPVMHPKRRFGGVSGGQTGTFRGKARALCARYASQKRRSCIPRPLPRPGLVVVVLVTRSRGSTWCSWSAGASPAV